MKRQSPTMLRALFLSAIIGLTLFVIALAIGCGGHFAPPSIPAVTGDLANAAAHTSSAQRVASDIPKHADATGKVESNFVVDELNLALESLKAGDANLQKVQSEYSQIFTDNQKKDAEVAAIKAGWGFKLQTFIHNLWVGILWIVGGAFALHFILLGVSLFFIGNPTGLLLTKLAGWIYPPAWAMWFVNGLHQKKAAQLAAVTSIKGVN